MDDLDREILNEIQWTFPLVQRPYDTLAEKFNQSPSVIKERILRLRESGILRQMSAIFDTRRLGYKSSLVAAKVESDKLDSVAELINKHPGVSHNYERDHEFNLWFTLAVPPDSDLKTELDKFSNVQGIIKMRMLPTIQLFKIGVKLDMVEGEFFCECIVWPLYKRKRPLYFVEDLHPNRPSFAPTFGARSPLVKNVSYYQGLKCRTIRVIQLIVDLYLKGGLAVVVGAGAEGLKKINSLLTQECEILLVSRESNPKVEKYLKDGAIKFLQADLQDAKFLLEYNPILVMATTDDHALNRMIVNEARKIPGCMAYASDDPESSDFSHPSVINIKDTVQITISTGSKSPAMAREIRMRAEKYLNELVTSEDVAQINLQQEARIAAKKAIPDQNTRKKYLYAVMRDSEVTRLIKQDRVTDARSRAMKMLEDFK